MGFSIEDVADPIGALTGRLLGSDGGGPPSFIMEELTGGRRKIELRGRCLPYRPVAWGRRQRTRRTWYQGNPVATQQVLGPEEPDTTITGTWKDRFIKGNVLVNDDPGVVTTAEQLVRVMYDVVGGGNEIRVQWASEVRTGVLKEFIPQYDRLQDIGFTLLFEWASRDDDVATRGAEEPFSLSDLQKAMNLLDDILSFEPEDMVRSFTARVIDTIEQARETVGRVFGLLRTAEAVASMPEHVLSAIRSSVDSMLLELREEQSRLNESSHPRTTTTTRAAGHAQAEQWRRDMQRQIQLLGAIALALEREAEARAVPRLVTVISVNEEASLYTLSQRLYGTPDFASFLARANKLRSARVPAGFQLRVPPRPSSPDSANSSGYAC